MRILRRHGPGWSSARRRSSQFTRLGLERLESRTLLTANFVGALDLSALQSHVDAWDPTRIIVQFKDEALAQLPDADVSSLLPDGAQGASTMHLTDGLYEVSIDPVMSVLDAVASYSAMPTVEYAQPNYRIQLEATPVDSSFSSLWGLNNTGQTGGILDADIDAAEAWNTSTGSGNFVVAVIDTGVDYNHPDLRTNMWVNPGEVAGNGIDDDRNGYVDDVHGYDFYDDDGDPMDDNGHGTHVAGTIGTQGNNGLGVTGINWNVQIMALKFLGPNGGYTSDAVRAIDYAVAEGVKLSNNSWGGSGFNYALSNAIGRAQNAGHIVVAAAGNDGANNDSFGFYPSNDSHDNVIAVAATNHRDQLAEFSNYGAATVDLAAPGVSILSTTPNGGYSHYSGTSMAAPHVTGAVALLWDRFPDLTYRQVIDSVLQHVDPVPALAGRVATGGRLNLASAFGSTTAVSASTVVGRHIFYNRSVFDGNNSGANLNDDAAVATDKRALLPGQTATFANYTSYSRGINGIMIDIDQLPGTPSLGDFEFRTGDGNNPNGWKLAPTPTNLSVRPVNGVDRITLIWSDHAIENQWLQVRVKASSRTGLVEDDVFYFGNMPGELSGDSFVGQNDMSGVLSRWGQSASIASAFDMDRDGFIVQSDLNNLLRNWGNSISTMTPPLLSVAVVHSSPLSIQSMDVMVLDGLRFAGMATRGASTSENFNRLQKPALALPVGQVFNLPALRSEDAVTRLTPQAVDTAFEQHDYALPRQHKCVMESRMQDWWSGADPLFDEFD